MKILIRNFSAFSLSLSILLVISCKKEKPSPPTLTTIAVTEISFTSAISGGDLTSEGGSPVLSRGICWNTSASPTIDNSKTIEVGGLGQFASNITQLIPNTTYYVRAYATNIAGTGYGNQVSFTTIQVAVPTLTTTTITSISQTFAFSGGNITSDNGGSIMIRGVCWSINQNPTTADFKSEDGAGTGAFTSSITGLTKGTTYNVRAYATNSLGTGYGNTQQFTTELGILFNPNLTYGSVTDIDGNVYKTITIGTQIWMAENLKTTKYSDGTPIPLVNTKTTWATLSTNSKAYSWHSDSIRYKDTYGALYTWAAAMNGAASSISNPSGVQGACPTGWHLPSDAEWTKLVVDICCSSTAGGKLKETGIAHWRIPNYGATNESGFTALPGDLRGPDGGFSSVGSLGYWWTSTEYNTSFGYNGINWLMSFSHGDASRSTGDYGGIKQSGLSVRCVKD